MAALQQTKRFMGDFGWSYFYGAGLVPYQHLSLATSCTL